MSIVGTWYNELGSQMVITEVEGTQLLGTYTTAVGDATYQYSLVGLLNIEPNSGGQAVGWTVVWTNLYGTSNSVTTWSGQIQDGKIITFWLLTSETMPANDWGATQIGQDTFTPVPPTAEAIAQARSQRAASHPRSLTK